MRINYLYVFTFIMLTLMSTFWLIRIIQQTQKSVPCMETKGLEFIHDGEKVIEVK